MILIAYNKLWANVALESITYNNVEEDLSIRFTVIGTSRYVELELGHYVLKAYQINDFLIYIKKMLFFDDYVAHEDLQTQTKQIYEKFIKNDKKA